MQDFFHPPYVWKNLLASQPNQTLTRNAQHIAAKTPVFTKPLFSETGDATTCTGSDHGFPETSWNFVGEICADLNGEPKSHNYKYSPWKYVSWNFEPRSPCLCPVLSPVSWQIHGILGFMTNYFKPKIKRIHGALVAAQLFLLMHVLSKMNSASWLL